VAKSLSKTEIRVKVSIKPVNLADVTPAQKTLYRRFWAKVISQVKDKLNNEQNPKYK